MEDKCTFILKSIILSEIKFHLCKEIFKDFEFDGNFKLGVAQKIRAVVKSNANKIIAGAKIQLIGIKKWGMISYFQGRIGFLERLKILTTEIIVIIKITPIITSSMVEEGFRIVITEDDSIEKLNVWDFQLCW